MPKRRLVSYQAVSGCKGLLVSELGTRENADGRQLDRQLGDVGGEQAVVSGRVLAGGCVTPLPVTQARLLLFHRDRRCLSMQTGGSARRRSDGQAAGHAAFEPPEPRQRSLCE